MTPPSTGGRGGPEVSVFDTTTAMARAAADQAAGVLRAAVAEKGVAHAMFATGNSQLAFVDALVHATADVPWSDVVVFHMDEYVGAGPDHPAGFQRLLLIAGLFVKRTGSCSGRGRRRFTSA